MPQRLHRPPAGGEPVSFDSAFRFFTAGAPVVDFPPALDAALRAELRDELASRRRLYPDRIAKGRMTRAEADKELRVWEWLVDDYCCAPGPPRATWNEQLHALRREVGLRRHFYPRWILAGRIDAGEADRKLALLEQWHDMLWHSPTNPDAIAARADVARRLAEREVRAAA